MVTGDMLQILHKGSDPTATPLMGAAKAQMVGVVFEHPCAICFGVRAYDFDNSAIAASSGRVSSSIAVSNTQPDRDAATRSSRLTNSQGGAESD